MTEVEKIIAYLRRKGDVFKAQADSDDPKIRERRIRQFVTLMFVADEIEEGRHLDMDQ